MTRRLIDSDRDARNFLPTGSLSFEAASGILARGRAVLERGAKELLEKETLMEGDLHELRNELLALLGAQRAPALLRAAEA